MKQSYFTDAKEFFPGSIVRNITFKNVCIGDSYIHLASICPILTARLGLSRGQSALFQKIDCFVRYLSPHEIAA